MKYDLYKFPEEEWLPASHVQSQGLKKVKSSRQRLYFILFFQNIFGVKKDFITNLRPGTPLPSSKNN